MSASQEALFKFVLEAKSTKNIALHGFSTYFYIGTTREAVLPTDFLEKLFLWGELFFKKLKQKQNLFF
jgi:hypothetical protein